MGSCTSTKARGKAAPLSSSTRPVIRCVDFGFRISDCGLRIADCGLGNVESEICNSCSHISSVAAFAENGEASTAEKRAKEIADFGLRIADLEPIITLRAKKSCPSPYPASFYPVHPVRLGDSKSAIRNPKSHPVIPSATASHERFCYRGKTWSPEAHIDFSSLRAVRLSGECFGAP